MSEPINLDEISREWLNPCGPHDYGMDVTGCTCPDGDPRPVISRLVAEVERVTAELDAAVGMLAEIGDRISPTGERPEEAIGTLVEDVGRLFDAYHATVAERDAMRRVVDAARNLDDALCTAVGDPDDMTPEHQALAQALAALAEETRTDG